VSETAAILIMTFRLPQWQNPESKHQLYFKQDAITKFTRARYLENDQVEAPKIAKTLLFTLRQLTNCNRISNGSFFEEKMLKKQFAFLALILMIINISCSYTPRSEVLTLSTSISQSLTSLTSKITLKSSEDFINKKIEPNFKDEKLAYIYKHRRELNICESKYLRSQAEPDTLTQFREKASRTHQINEQKYILELGCYPGAYNVSKEFLLYLINNYGIEIKPLFVLKRSDGEGIDFNGQPIWVYRQQVGGLPKFDPDTLILKNNTVKNNGGYKAEYKFEDDEFKLLKYTIFPNFQMQQKRIGAKDIYP
jgi:hypothetical protein